MNSKIVATQPASDSPEQVGQITTTTIASCIELLGKILAQEQKVNEMKDGTEETVPIECVRMKTLSSLLTTEIRLKEINREQ